MSDPVTNVEIEDVLSSIRRLVSDGDKARTRDPAPAEAAEDASTEAPEMATESAPSQDNADRLVLTPALLVVDSDNGVSPTPAMEEKPLEVEDATWEQGDAGTQDTDGNTTQDFAEEAAEDDWSDDSWTEDRWADDTISDNTTDQSEAALGEASILEAVSETVSDAPFALTDRIADDSEPQDEEAADESPLESASDRSGLVATIAELEAAISAGEDDFEPDGSEVDTDNTLSWPGTVRADDGSADTGQFEADGDRLDDTVDTNENHHTAEAEDWDSKDWDAQGLGPIGRDLSNDDPIGAATADLETEADVVTLADAAPDEASSDTVVLAETGDATAEMPSQDTSVGDEVPKGDDAEIASFAHRTLDAAPMTATPAMGAVSTTQAAVQDDYADDDDLDGLLDEKTAQVDPEALRSLVAEVVRQELAGTMGEKITRNVRKLVRREIYRILSSQEFD